MCKKAEPNGRRAWVKHSKRLGVRRGEAGDAGSACGPPGVKRSRVRRRGESGQWRPDGGIARGPWWDSHRESYGGAHSPSSSSSKAELQGSSGTTSGFDEDCVKEMGRMALVQAALIILMALAGGGRGQMEDTACLSNLRRWMEDPQGRLLHWTGPNLKAPCHGAASDLEGVTCNNDRVYKLSLVGFGLGGTITPYISNCTNLQSLDLSANRLSGQIPTDLQYLINLAVLNLSVNQLTGPIPPQLAMCAYLNVIDLHSNQLTGPIPPQLGLLIRLSAFDVSKNQLSGPIPISLANKTGNITRFNASSFAGNRDLYGFPLPPPKNHGLSILAIVGIGLGSGLLSLVVSFTAVCIWLRVTEQGMAAEEGKITQLMPEY